MTTHSSLSFGSLPSSAASTLRSGTTWWRTSVVSVDGHVARDRRCLRIGFSAARARSSSEPFAPRSRVRASAVEIWAAGMRTRSTQSCSR